MTGGKHKTLFFFVPPPPPPPPVTILDIPEVTFVWLINDTRRYGLLLAPAEGFGLWTRLFFPSSGKKRAFYAVLAFFESEFSLKLARYVFFVSL